MSLTISEVEHIAELARLELTDQEIDRYRQQLSTILEYFEQIQEVDTKDVPPTSSVLPTRRALRPDDPRPGLVQDELLRNAPDVESDQFRVPPILE